MILDYIYHSGFAIEAEGVTLIMDYYKDSSETELNKGIVHDRLHKIKYRKRVKKAKFKKIV